MKIKAEIRVFRLFFRIVSTYEDIKKKRTRIYTIREYKNNKVIEKRRERKIKGTIGRFRRWPVFAGNRPSN